jgi:DNA-directed RNA polymerase subunit RPC12/RpoP
MPLFRKKEKETEKSCIKCGAKILSDADYCTTCGSSQKPTPPKHTKYEIGDWRKALTIKDAEYVVLDTIPNNIDFEFIAFGVGLVFDIKHGFVLTNQRLITLGIKYAEEKDGITEVSFELEKEFPLVSIKDVTYQNDNIAVYTDEGKCDCGGIMRVTGLAYPKNQTPERCFNYLREKIIEQKEKRATVTLDFSSLKSVMEKGGIVVTTLACPKCNAPMKIPTDGTETVCEHCGSRVIAQDIFKKLKTLLS